MRVNLVDLPRQYKDIKELVIEDISDALDKGSFIGSESFEKKFAEYHGSSYCVGVGSGTDALWLSLLSLGIGSGDEVIVPANTYIATAFAVSHTGAKPVFIDPDPVTYTINGNSIENVITSNTKAIIPVHLYGYPADMSSVLSVANHYGLYVIEDCAQAAGAVYKGKKTGSFGDVGCYSFYPAKNLGGLGQGGAVITDNYELSETVRELGNVGRSRGSWFDYSYVGMNSRLDYINSKFLERCLVNLDSWNAKRSTASLWYGDGLREIDGLSLPVGAANGTNPVFHLYEVKLNDKETRDRLKLFLESMEISTGLHYPKPCHRQCMYKDYYYSCYISDNLSDTLISLPIHPSITNEEVNYVCYAIKEFFSGLK